MLYAHFITCSCYRRRQTLEEDQPKRILLGVFNQQLVRRNASCVGFVIMPEHVHAVVWFPQPGQLSLFIQEWKRISPERINTWFQCCRPKYWASAGMDGQFWQPKYYSFEIYAQEKLREEVD